MLRFLLIAAAVSLGLCSLVQRAHAEAPAVKVNGTNPTAANVQAELDRIAAMTTAEQQAWLRRLEQRGTHAARLTLNPEQAAEQRQHIRAKIYQKTVSWQTMRQLIEETDAGEKKAIDQLVRKHHGKLSDTVDGQTDVANRRRDQWNVLYQDWKDSGSSFAQQDKLIAWLESGIQSLELQSVERMPEPPSFAAPRTADPVAPNAEDALPPTKTSPEPTAPPPGKASISKAAPAKGVIPDSLKSPTEPVRRSEPAPSNRMASNPKVAAGAANGPKATASSSEPPQPPAVHIDVEELAARVAGCNLEFRALESELDEKGSWNAARLEPLVDRLKILLLRRHDLRLFRESLPEEKRTSVAKLESPKTAISQLAAKIADIRKRVSESTQGTDAERQAELTRLDALSRSLADMADAQ